MLGGRYELRERLGAGGMADVFEGYDTRLARRVAIKILRAELPDDRTRARFEQEARLAARFSHPNAVVVYDVGEDGDRPYFVMELVEGTTLAHVLQDRGPLGPVETVAILRQVLDALGAAHAEGLVHRDVKPGNVLLTSDGRVKLADFGIAKVASDATSDLTATGQVIGTAKYLSPEQVSGRPVDARADVYAAGVMLYEMLCGEPPFTADSPVAMAVAHQQSPVPPVRSRRRDAPTWLAAIAERALEKDPAKRFPNAQAMRAALDGVDDDATRPFAGATARPTRGATGSLTATAPLPPDARVPTPRRPARTPEPPPRRSTWLALLLLLALLLVAGVVIALTAADSSDNAGPSTRRRNTTTTSPSSTSTTAAPTTTSTSIATTTTLATPQTLNDLIALLQAGAANYGPRGGDLLARLQTIASDLARPGKQAVDKKAVSAINEIQQWVAKGELDESIGNVAQQLLAPIANS